MDNCPDEAIFSYVNANLRLLFPIVSTNIQFTVLLPFELDTGVAQGIHTTKYKCDDKTSTKQSYSYNPEKHTARLQTTHYFTLPLAFSVHYIASFALYINISMHFLCSVN